MKVRVAQIVLRNNITMKIDTGETFIVGPEDKALFSFWDGINVSTTPPPYYLQIFENGYYKAVYGLPSDSIDYLPVSAVLSYVENFNDKIVSELYDNGLDDQHPHLLEFVSQGGTDYALRMFGCWLYDTENHDPLSYHGDCTLPWLDTLIKKWVHTVAKSVLWVIPDKL